MGSVYKMLKMCEMERSALTTYPGFKFRKVNLPRSVHVVALPCTFQQVGVYGVSYPLKAADRLRCTDSLGKWNLSLSPECFAAAKRALQHQRHLQTNVLLLSKPWVAPCP